MGAVVFLVLATVAVTMVIDFFWWVENRDRRQAVRRTAQAMCCGRIRSPSGFFIMGCPRRASYARAEGRHYCFDPNCEHGQS